MSQSIPPTGRSSTTRASGGCRSKITAAPVAKSSALPRSGKSQLSYKYPLTVRLRTPKCWQPDNHVRGRPKMKSGLTLVELAQEIERRKEAKKDYVVDTRALDMDGDQLWFGKP